MFLHILCGTLGSISVKLFQKLFYIVIGIVNYEFIYFSYSAVFSYFIFFMNFPVTYPDFPFFPEPNYIIIPASMLYFFSEAYVSQFYFIYVRI